jgi:hypothetical protein
MTSRIYPVPLFARQLERAWARELSARFGCSEAEFLADPAAQLKFPAQGLRVELMDGSFVEFRYAFALVCETRKAIAVFTEHCGHHAFPYHEARILVGGRVAYEQCAA